MMPYIIAADPPISAPVIRPFIIPLFTVGSLLFCFGHVNDDVAIFPVQGKALDPGPSAQQIVPKSTREFKGAHAKAHLVDFRARNGAQTAAIRANRPPEERLAAAALPDTRIICHHRDLSQHGDAVRGDESRAAQPRIHPDAFHAPEVAGQLHLHDATGPAIVDDHRHTDQRADFSHISPSVHLDSGIA